jgi:hypothetical protein
MAGIPGWFAASLLGEPFALGAGGRSSRWAKELETYISMGGTP